MTRPLLVLALFLSACGAPPPDAGGDDAGTVDNGPVIDAGTSEDGADPSPAMMCTQAGTHLCGANCVSNSAVSSCGVACTACPTDPNGTATCDGTSCGVTCNPGAIRCSGACAACPSDPHATRTGCGSGTSCVVTECSAGYAPCLSGCCPITDCRIVGCTGFTYCNTTNGVCTSGCASSSQCAGDETCNLSSHACVCGAGTHSCSASCVADVSIDHCGASCTACPGDPHGTATCDGTSCGVVCDASAKSCGGACAVCPSVPGATTGCAGNTCVVTACAAGYVLLGGTCRAVAAIAQQAYIKASNTGASDYFGYAIALSADGNTLVVGAGEEDGADNSLTDSGAVYVFVRTAGVWTQQAYLKAADSHADDGFGNAVALSADGNTLAVGASRYGGLEGRTGAVYVFVRVGATWSQQMQRLPQSSVLGGYFGFSVALSASGDDLLVGAPCMAYGKNRAKTCTRGNVVGEDPMHGMVELFRRTGTTWVGWGGTEAPRLTSNNRGGDLFGWEVAISADGRTWAVGAPGEGSCAYGIDGDASNHGCPQAGAVLVYVDFVKQAYVKAPHRLQSFGFSLALSADGSTLAVGTPSEDSKAKGINNPGFDSDAVSSGAAFVFVRNGTSWSQQAYVKASNTAADAAFGHSVALAADGNTLLVGAPSETSLATGIDGDQTMTSATAAGAAYSFVRQGVAWAQQAYIKASTAGASFFGSVALAGDGHTFAVGAPWEASCATGINGNQLALSCPFAGAAYVFTQ